MKIADFLERMLIAETEEAKRLFEKALADLGFHSYAYGKINQGETIALDICYPQQWISRYFEAEYEKIDPVTNNAIKNPKPFLWSEMKLSTLQKRFMGEAAEFGLKNGAVLPIRTSRGHFVLSTATPEIKIDPRIIWRLYMLATHFHLCLESKQVSTDIVLTPREKECLTWSSRGKSSWDISQILAISESTVNFHITNAMNKLGCSSRIATIIKAIHLRLIQP